MRHIISALVINEPGVLANVAGMFAARGFNIDSLVVGRTENPDLSRMTVVCDADDNTLEQVRKQLAKLVPVVQVRDYTGSRYIERDLALITVQANASTRGEVVELVNLFRGKVVDISKNSVVVELSGPEEKIEAFIELIGPYGIKDLARTGVIAIPRGTQFKREDAPQKPDRTGAPSAASGDSASNPFTGSGTRTPRKRSLNAPSAPALPPS